MKRDKSPNADRDLPTAENKRFKRASRWDPAPPTSSQSTFHRFYFLHLFHIHVYSLNSYVVTYTRSKGSGPTNVFRPSIAPSFQPATVVPTNTRPSLAGGPVGGSSSLMGHPPPLHNTVTIVQQPTGQSLYVQQQIFTPSAYLPPVTMTTRVEPYQQPNLIPTVHQVQIIYRIIKGFYSLIFN